MDLWLEIPSGSQKLRKLKCYDRLWSILKTRRLILFPLLRERLKWHLSNNSSAAPRPHESPRVLNQNEGSFVCCAFVSMCCIYTVLSVHILNDFKIKNDICVTKFEKLANSAPSIIAFPKNGEPSCGWREKDAVRQNMNLLVRSLYSSPDPENLWTDGSCLFYSPLIFWINAEV